MFKPINHFSSASCEKREKLYRNAASYSFSTSITVIQNACHFAVENP